MIELLLDVETAGDPSEADPPGHHTATGVRVELDEGHRIVDLASALASHLDVPVPDGHTPKLACRRLGRVLEADDMVLATGLVSGDTVHLGDTAAVPDRPSADLGGLVCDVISGPGSGASVPLVAGSFSIGRDPSCDLVLDDPTVSERHVTLLVDVARGIQIAPAQDATNPVVVDGRPLARQAVLHLDATVQLGACALSVRHHTPSVSTVRDQLGQIAFNRTPYRHPDLRSVEVPGPGTPPQPHEPRPLMLSLLLLPLVGGVAFALFLQRWYFLLFALLSPLSMVASWWSERRRGGTTHREQVAVFERSFERWLERYDDALKVERRRRHAAAPDVADLARRARLRTADLWARTRWSDGFLELRLGLGTAPARTTTCPPRGSDADPDGRVLAAIDRRRQLTSVPITVDLMRQPVLAVHGASSEVEAVVGSLVTQVAVLHSPDDVVLCGYLDRARSLSDWLAWLPHTRAVASPLAGNHLAAEVVDADDLLRRLVAVIAERDGESAWPHLLVLLDERVAADHLLVAAVLEAGPAVGVHAVWVGEEHARLPRQACAVLTCPPTATGLRARLWFTDPTEPTRALAPDRIGLEQAPLVARALAPVRDASSPSAASAIPRMAPLLATLGAERSDADGVARSWRANAQRYGLDAPIGIGTDGPLMVDLVEDGPHALIAGTSGAGKSEFLQSYIAALIATYPPSRLNLLFIDYKGGASSSAFEAVPHTVGYVTNLGADLAMRALVSLRAELDRRMRILEGRAKGLGEMLERFPDEAPASLVIVVDEFATLVKEIPDFVAGMVDIAQRGRSLGIHLILATQRPAGAVSDDILANTNLRIALRVLDPADSSSVLGTADAAGIPQPLRGRGFVRRGSGGPIEFQSAYAGARFQMAAGVAAPAVTRFPVDATVTRHPALDGSDAPSGGPCDAPSDDRPDERPDQRPDERPDQRPDAPGEAEHGTHLDVLLRAVVRAGETLQVLPGRRPWLEALPTPIDLAQVLDGGYGGLEVDEPGRDVVLGVVDEPHLQRQRPFVVDLEDRGGLLVFGTAGSGRSTVLRTVVASVVSRATPTDAAIHVLDLAGRGLESLRCLPHVAAVAPGEDLEQITRILMYLDAEVSRRQDLMAAARAEDLTAYNRARPGERLPRLLLLLDGYEAFQRAFDRSELYPWSELLVSIVLSGRSVGLHLIATADRRVGVPATLANAVGGRLLLRTVDADGLTDLGVPSAIARAAVLGGGRSLLPDGSTVQVALAGGAPEAAAQGAALAQLAGRTADGRSTSVPVLPDDVVAADLPASGDPSRITLGLADLTLQPVMCDVRLQHLTIVGPGGSGRSTALHTAARGLAAAGRDVRVITAAGSPLCEGAWSRLAIRRDDHLALVEELAAAAPHDLDQPPPVLVIDQVEQLDDAADGHLERLLREPSIRLLASADPASLSGYVAGWRRELKATRRLLLLRPDELGDVTAFTSARVRLRPGQRFGPGRGLFISNHDVELIQVAR